MKLEESDHFKTAKIWEELADKAKKLGIDELALFVLESKNDVIASGRFTTLLFAVIAILATYG